MSSDLGTLPRILKDFTRRRIIELLREKGPLTYVEVLNLLEIEHTGKLNYHLKLLGDLIEKDQAGMYSLTEKGQLAMQVLSKFEPMSRPSETSLIRLSGIGLAKLLFVLAIPSFVVSLTPLSQDYTAATGFAFLMGLVTSLLLMFGGALVVPKAKWANGFASFSQSLRYSLVEVLLVLTVFFWAIYGSTFCTRCFDYSTGVLEVLPAILVYILFIPGYLTWLLVSWRLGIHRLSELLKIPLTGTFLLLTGAILFTTGLVEVVSFAGVVNPARVNLLVAYQTAVNLVVPMLTFLFLGLFASEGAQRLISWKGHS